MNDENDKALAALGLLVPETRAARLLPDGIRFLELAGRRLLPALPAGLQDCPDSLERA